MCEVGGKVDVRLGTSGSAEHTLEQGGVIQAAGGCTNQFSSPLPVVEQETGCAQEAALQSS